jgi:hypothetical protein
MTVTIPHGLVVTPDLLYSTGCGSSLLGEVPLGPWSDIEIYNWDGQTLYCFEACRVLTMGGMQ